MNSLTICSDSVLGPLDVSVYPPSGDPIDFTLSSGHLEQSVKVEPGRYVIVARRPNGARIHRNVVVGGKDETVYLVSDVGSSPNEFMSAETFRGQVGRASESDLLLPWRATLPGSAGVALGSAVLGAVSIGTVDGYLPPITPFGALAASVNTGLDMLRTAKPPGSFALRIWRLNSGQRWETVPASGPAGFVTQARVSGDFLKIEIETRGKLLCVGLLDTQGFGPIVNIPPFAEPVEVTFLSKGVLVQAADRMATPGGQRVPIALVTPVNRSVADLLTTLAAPATLGAGALWQQSVGVLDPGNGEVALEMFSQKFTRPAEALLAAHFLLRFLPQNLPLDWVDNLKTVLPDVADGPAISAWARVLNRPLGISDEQVDSAVEENIKIALSRPVTLFARTRALLADARHLVSKDLAGAAAWKQEGEYRRFGAEAAGLESFWGLGPALPGKSGSATSGLDIVQVKLINGGFAQPVFLEAH